LEHTADTDPIFAAPGRRKKPLGDSTLLAVIKRMGESFTTHGMRSAFRDWAAEQTHYPRELVELCLAHNIASKVEKAYLRSDMLEKRRPIMDAFALYCSTPTDDARSGAEIVPFPDRLAG
jgi:hypothetical protein